jgi:hypothetical protein
LKLDQMVIQEGRAQQAQKGLFFSTGLVTVLMISRSEQG